MIEPSAHDPRFTDKEWTENAFFDFLKQAYLLAGKWAEDMVHNASTVDAHIKHRAEFYLNQIVSALSPSNFPFTNPEVIRATVSTGAKNLAQGMTHLLEDLDRSGTSQAGRCYARPQQNNGPHLRSSHKRRPYRARRIGSARREAFRRAGSFRAGRIGPYRRRDQSPRKVKIHALDFRGRRRKSLAFCRRFHCKGA